MKYFRQVSLLIFFMLFAWGCTDSENMRGVKSLDYPLRISVSSEFSLKADKNDLITNQNLQLYYFKENDAGEFVFAHSSKPDDLVISGTGSSNIEVTTNIPFQAGTSLKLIMLTNFSGPPPSKGQTIDNYSSENLIYKLKGPWADEQTIPMWGVGAFTIQSGGNQTLVKLLRSLARVDVLLDNANVDPKTQYKMTSLTSVRVYRTLNEVALAVPAQNMGSNNIVNFPTLVSGALYNVGDSGTSSLIEADKHPLVYEITGGSSVGLTDKIFIPENYHKADAKLSQVVTMVIGVNLEGKGSKEYFYRIDFGNYDNPESLLPSSFYSILRNHLYKFLLRGATLIGSDTPEEALQAKSSVWVGVETWITEDINADINGQYYFRIDTSTINLSEEQGDQVAIPFSTNIPDADLDNAIVLAWGENESSQSQYFEATTNYKTHEITVRTKTENTSADERFDMLVLSVFKQKFKIKVEQSDKTADYVITQKHYKVNGVYVNGRELNESNTITLRLYGRLKDSNLKGLDYHLVASPVDGIYIDYEGRFDNIQLDESVDLYYEEITVPVQGKSTMAKDKLLTIVADGASYSLLNVTVPYALGKKKILDFYGIESTATQNIQQLVNLPGNFSLDANAYVFSEGNLLISSKNTDMATEIAEHNPDVIIIRDNYPLTAAHIDVLYNFMKARNQYRASNSVLAFTTNPLILKLFEKMNLIGGGAKLVKLNISQEGSTAGFNDIQPKMDGVNTLYRYQIPVYTQNFISNGPFGNIGSRYIALDKDGVYIENMSDLSIFKFTGTVPFADTFKTIDQGISMFSTYSYNLMWVGLDSFLTSKQDKWFFENGRILDYKLGSYNFTTGYGDVQKTMTLTSNGILFANALYWALYNSEYKASN